MQRQSKIGCGWAPVHGYAQAHGSHPATQRTLCRRAPETRRRWRRCSRCLARRRASTPRRAPPAQAAPQRQAAGPRVQKPARLRGRGLRTARPVRGLGSRRQSTGRAALAMDSAQGPRWAMPHADGAQLAMPLSAAQGPAAGSLAAQMATPLHLLPAPGMSLCGPLRTHLPSPQAQTLTSTPHSLPAGDLGSQAGGGCPARAGPASAGGSVGAVGRAEEGAWRQRRERQR